MGYRLDAAREYRRKIDAATAMLSDEQAVAVKELYREWAELIGQSVKQGYKFRHEDKLYKTLQSEYTFVEQYVPGSIGTESLFAVINEAHAGTIDDPIPYEGNMELVSGLYYIEDGIMYRCTRDTEIPVYSPLKELVGLYVEVVDDSTKSSSGGLLTED